MSTDISKYIPTYPQVGSPSLSEKLSAHLEFRDESFQQSNFFKHQQMISRFISPRTSYRSLLFFHEMGSGKTCTAVSICETFFMNRSDTNIQSALVLCRGQTLVDNFSNEIINICAKKKYHGSKTREFRSRYKFSTFDVFSRTGAQHPELYKNSIIIIDEAHRLVTTGEDGTPSHVYNSIRDFIHTVQGCRLILLTGTPMRDDASEILKLMELMPDIPEVPESVGDTQLLRSLLYGRVSHVSTIESGVQKVYVGTSIGGLQHLKVYPSTMSSFQDSEYMRVYDRRNIFIDARQASLFVFPKGETFNTSFKITVKRGKKFTESQEGKNTYAMSDSLRNSIMRFGLETFSPKYKTVIDILEKNKSELAFVYCEFVEGSGCILFSKILEMYGYTRSTGKDTSPALRYAIVTNKTTSEKQTARIISRFNARDNMYGEYIRVIIGSRVMSEGVSLKNVRQVHILTPHWNYAETDQAVARSIRSMSHVDLLSDGVVPVVNIYHHVSVSRGTVSQSIDLQMYVLSEKKDIEIKRVERILKECAFDCAILPHSVKGDDFSRECDYMRCEYVCPTDRTSGSKALEDEKAAYLMYYSEDDVRRASEYIKNIFSTTRSIEIDVPYAYDISYRACDMLGQFADMFGRPVRVRCDTDSRSEKTTRIYAYIDSGSHIVPSEKEARYYVSNISIYSHNSLERESEHLYYTRYMSAVINELFGKDNSEFDFRRSQELFGELDDSVKQVVLEACVIGFYVKSYARKSAVVKFVVDRYSEYVSRDADNLYVYMISGPRGLVRIYSISNKSWATVPETEVSRTLEKYVVNKDSMSSFEYHGVVDVVRNNFLIKKRDDPLVSDDKRRANRGRVCTTIDRNSLQEIYHTSFGTEDNIDLGMSKKDLCLMLKRKFEEKKMIEFLK